MARREKAVKKIDLSKVPDALILAEAGRRRRAMASTRPKVLHECQHCGKMFGAAEVRKHRPVCPRNPKNRSK